MADEAKRRAQEALYAAIQNQAENNMRAALSAPEKASLLLDLAQAYRLAAGGAMPTGVGRGEGASSAGERSRGGARGRQSRDGGRGERGA
jgi:hypothetical protein